MTSRTTSDRGLALSSLLLGVSLGCGSASGNAAPDDGGGLETGMPPDGAAHDSGDGAPAHDAGRDATTDGSVDASNDASPDAPPNQDPPYDEHAGDRLACAFGPGDTTLTTIGPNVPHGDALPFSHIVVLMMENRSFDHYLSGLPAMGVTDVDVADDSYTNPDPGPPFTNVNRYHETRYCIADLTHDWGPVHLQYDDGAMDGFIATQNPGGARAMGWYDSSDLPFYYWFASTFAISDRYFSSLLGPTWPNRFFFYGATSWGRTSTPDTPP